jgi:Zn-dependent peptidase ImmA (M78 family)/transcriptional regulator with XRE-family HTH domain
MELYNSFGQAAMESRKLGGLSLREAARSLEVSPSYLSKIELDKSDPPSAEVIRSMATLYQVPVVELLKYAKERVRDVIGDDVRDNEGLFALYRVANGMKPDEIFSLIGKLLAQLPPDEKARYEAKIKSQFPRLSRGESFLYAPRVRPRFLSKVQIRSMAEGVLASHGITRENYMPPTPIEKIIEDTAGVYLHPSDSPEMRCEKDGSPVVLGLTRWDIDGQRRLIEINECLYDSEERRQRRRLNYTLAHEYWHAIEHLPLMDRPARQDGGMFRLNIDAPAASVQAGQRKKWWEKSAKRRFETNEDWQEWQAQYFASELLMPHWSIREEFSKRFASESGVASDEVSMRKLADQLAGEMMSSSEAWMEPLDDLFDVSRQAMAIRLLELGLVSCATPAAEGGVRH